jgi:hypothetical protein
VSGIGYFEYLSGGVFKASVIRTLSKSKLSKKSWKRTGCTLVHELQEPCFDDEIPFQLR